MSYLIESAQKHSAKGSSGGHLILISSIGAAKYIPHAQLDVLPSQVNHEIFDNECDQIGRDNYPESCIEAPGVDRANLHDYIGNAALKFFDRNLGVQRQSPN